MRGKELKEWVLEKTKSRKGEHRTGSTTRAETAQKSSAAQHPKPSDGDDGSTMQGDAGRPAKVTFPVKGTPFRVDRRYAFERTLGVGAYGVVCSASDEKEKRRVAIKKVGALFDDLTDAKRILREIRLISSMKHENILKIVDIDEPENYAQFNDIYLITELMDTDLNKLLRSKHVLLEAQRRFFTYQILRAMKYIHSASILHRDLKPANIVVSENCDLKICDFGLARFMDPEDGPSQAMTEYVVTRWYRAPELLLSTGEYTSAIDMWSVGCILAELYCRDPLFPGKDVKNQIAVICEVIGKPSGPEIAGVKNRRARDFISLLPPHPRKDLGKMLRDVSPEAADLIGRLLQFDPDRRLTAAQALDHPYVADYRDKTSEIEAGSSLAQFDLEPPSERRLGADGIRRLMWDEMLRFHPDARAREPAAAEAAEKRVAALQGK